MSSPQTAQPVHNRGTAAEQGAAVRRRFEEQQEQRRRRHESLQRDRSGPATTAATPLARREVTETKARHRSTPPPPPVEANLARRNTRGKQRRYSRDEDNRAKRSSTRSRYGGDEQGVGEGGGRRASNTRQRSRRAPAVVAGIAGTGETGQDAEVEDEVKPSRRDSRALRKEAEAREAEAPLVATAGRRGQRGSVDQPPVSRDGSDEVERGVTAPSTATRAQRYRDGAAEENEASAQPDERADEEPTKKGNKTSRFAPLAALAALGGLGAGTAAAKEKETSPRGSRDRGDSLDQGAGRRRNYANRKPEAEAIAAAPAAERRSSQSNRNGGAAAYHDLQPEYVDDDGERIEGSTGDIAALPALSEHDAPTEDDDGHGSEVPAQAAESEEGVLDDDDDDEEEEEEGEQEEPEDEVPAQSRRRGAAASGAAGAAAGAAMATSASDHDNFGIEKKGRVYPLTGIDNVALLMEDDGYQTACFSVYLFKTKLDYETVVDFFQKLSGAYPKYRYVCELDPAAANKKDKMAKKGEPFRASGFDAGRKTKYSKSLKAGGLLRPARWRIDENFRVEDNIRVVRADSPGDDRSLFDLCGQCLSEHFDFSKPLWEAVLVHGLRTSEGARSGLMIKIHHAFSDGQGMIQSYHSAIEAMQQGVSIANKQAEIDSKIAQAASRAREQSEKGHEQKNIGSRNVKPSVGATISHTWHTVRGLYFRNRTTFTYPDSAGKEAVKAYGAKLGKNHRPSTRFYAHSEGISMTDIKLIRQAFSTDKVNLSLNDVACAILSRALRIAAEDMANKQGVQKKKRVTDKRVALFIPVSKRPKGDWTLANYTTGTVAWFRFHEPSQYGFEQLLNQVHREMNRIKRSHLPTIWYRVFNMVCKRRIWQLPNYPGFRAFFQAAYSEYHVFTNVPGPSKTVSFGKHEAFSYHVLPPSSPGKSTMAMGAISYANDFSLAVSCDGIPRFDEYALPETICDAFQRASEELVRAAKTKLGK
ncbi:unnamed protein product [Parajaminaea phylloscopi]